MKLFIFLGRYYAQFNKFLVSRENSRVTCNSNLMTSTLVSVEIQWELKALPLLLLSIERQIAYLPDARKIQTALKCTQANVKKEPFRT